MYLDLPKRSTFGTEGVFQCLFWAEPKAALLGKVQTHSIQK
jgi:hypothetical protein